MISFVPIIGILMAVFIPGLFVTLIFFKEVSLLERLLLSITFSIMIAVAIGIALGYNHDVAKITGGINPNNVWKLEIVITSILAFAALMVNFKSISLKSLIVFTQKIKIPTEKLKKEKEIVKYKKL